VKQLKAIVVILILAFIALLPLRLTQALGSLLGRWMMRQDSKMVRITRRNIAVCFPELDQQQQTALVHDSMIETGKTLLEMGMSWLWPVSLTLSKVKGVYGEELISDSLGKGKGVIMIAPHLGNWEILNLYLGSRYPLTAMYKPPKLKLMDDLIKKMRARVGTRMAPASKTGVMMVLKSLKRGEVVGILPDQKPEAGSGVFVPFFGVEAYTMRLVSQLAKREETVAVCAYAERLPKGRGYKIYIREVDPRLYGPDLPESMAAMNRSIEACVRAIPDQYQWEYTRFDRRPEGQPPIY
jgi:KDO2-lipid IV(A) lauroyltransferase